jgi:hypothetical protein
MYTLRQRRDDQERFVNERGLESLGGPGKRATDGGRHVNLLLGAVQQINSIAQRDTRGRR